MQRFLRPVLDRRAGEAVEFREDERPRIAPSEESAGGA